MSIDSKTYYEIRPGFDSLRYLLMYGVVTFLSRKNRAHQFFTEGRSNIDRHIISDGYFEKGVLDVLRTVIDRTGHRRLMIDVGANIGNHTVALANEFRNVESVEPHPVLFHILTANVMRNGLSNVTVHNFGLANEDTSAVLVSPAESHGAAMVKSRSLLSQERHGRTSEQWREEFPIELKDASDFLSAFGADLDEAFIKIDVEGMEQEIVTAILPVLETFRPIVAFEWFTQAQPELGQIVAALDGYELWGIHSLDEVGPNLILRGARLLMRGREIRLDRIDLDAVAPVYTLALLVPTGKLGQALPDNQSGAAT